ncbi:MULTISPECIES: DMT family transporter [unclassified Microbacterium]|uniref:DMT family transporter n=1 Tax=unclassified Microbacterium TaxID=2609290 RepID=UPI00214CB6BB|nr:MULTISPECIES: DMT family transporter [unclassified Microbacterium]MCR2808260.1 DMT family transporter [Microbacterium sp. zg.B185]WIM19284.1 DMT family transporter [Microbacterium sp. zg-B185]
MSIGILLAMGSAVAYGASDFIGGVGSRRYSSWQVVLVGQSAGALVMLAGGLTLPGNPVALDFVWAVVAGVGSATGSIFLYRGLARGRMGLVAPVSAVGAATLPVLAGVAFGERPGWLAWIGMLAALPGIWLVSRRTDTDRPTNVRGGLIDGIVAGVGFGVLFIALAQISEHAGLLPLAANQLIGALLTVLTAAGLGQVWRPTSGVLGWGTAAGVLGAAGTLAFMIATEATTLGIAAVLASLYPAVTVLLAAGVLRERVAVTQGAGIGICTLAVAAMALG